MIALKKFINKLLNLEKSTVATAPTVTTQTKSTLSNQDRAKAILDYWLDIEMFELPECPVAKGDDILSISPGKFAEKMAELTERLKAQPDYIKKESRLTIMFQCHRAGYIFDNSNSENRDNNYANNPNTNIPRTFVVAQNFIPKWDAEKQILTWSLSTEAQDLTLNFSTIRTIYRKCSPATAHNQRFSQWLENRNADITNLFKTTFVNEQTNGQFTTEEFAKKLKGINRDLAKKFWADKNAEDFMKRHCGAMEMTFANGDKINEEDKPHEGDEILTFPWRFSFFPEAVETQQLGPFFIADLENCLTQLYEKGMAGLSQPLQRYLLGNSQQTFLPPVTNHGHIYQPLTQNIPLGRWTSNSKYGLSLMQSVAVNVALSPNEPIVAVNGPPGTGKTTLLKDIIATHIVERTIKLSKLMEKYDWFTDSQVHSLILRHSIIVASSNNKAVENISKELPAKASVDKEFANKISHFTTLAKESDGGLFCAVLGNSANRRDFKDYLDKIEKQLKYQNDIFKLQALVAVLKKEKDKSKRTVILRKNVETWQKKQQIMSLLKDLRECSNFEKHKEFFEPFARALQKIDTGDLTLDSFIDTWENMDDTQWDVAITALEAVKKQWFGKKMFESHQHQKLTQAKDNFNQCYQQLMQGLTAQDKGYVIRNAQDWQLAEDTHLLSSQAYLAPANTDLAEMEESLQLKSPYASSKLNKARSELFCASMRLNEALLEQSASQFTAEHWKDLKSLIDGNLQSNETTPYHAQLWALLFLFFPVVSTSLSSVENQFKQMQKMGGFGIGIVDEAGQAVNYHVVGLMQRCQQLILVGDPIQLEPVVTIPYAIDVSLAKDYLQISEQHGEKQWGDNYIVSTSSAQSIADLAGRYYAKIGDRQVGIPLFVHRRCLEPMFSIANRIAYDNKMVSDTSDEPSEDKVLESGWIHVAETNPDGKGYYNNTEAKIALDTIKHLAINYPHMLKGGVFIITPFSNMKTTAAKQWKNLAKQASNEAWMRIAMGEYADSKILEDFAKDNIGTVHTFQGKEASVVILCLSASVVRGKSGGITWVNGKPNLINVAVTRAKKQLFVIGNLIDWQVGTISSQLQSEDMSIYESFDDFIKAKGTNMAIFNANHPSSTTVTFNFGG